MITEIYHTQVYNFETKTWVEMASAPHPLAWAIFVAVSDRLYAFNAWDDAAGTTSDTIQVFSVEDNVWKVLEDEGGKFHYSYGYINVWELD